MKNRQRGKRNEMALERYLQQKGFRCRRLGILGKEDLELVCGNKIFLIEAKVRQKFVAKDWYEKIKKHCKQGEVALVVVHVANQRREQDLVIMNMENFVSILESFKEVKNDL